MSKMYQSVRGVVQGTLRPRKPHFRVPAQPNENNGNLGDLNDVLEQLEKIFLDGIGRLKTAVAQDHAAVTKSARDAEELIGVLKANISALEAKLKETEDTVDQKEIASREVEESLRTEIRHLQGAVTSKEEVLAGRESEVQNLKSKTDVLVQRVSELESAAEQTKGEATRQAQRAEEVIETLRANIGALEAQLKETEGTVHQKEIASREMEESLSTEIRDLRVIAKSKEEALTSRESEVQDLKSKADAFVERVTELEYALEQAKGEAANKAQDAEQVIAGLKERIVTVEGRISQTEQTVDGTGLIVDQHRHSRAGDLHLREMQRNGTKDSKSHDLLSVQQQGRDSVLPDKQTEQAEVKPRPALVLDLGVEAVVAEPGLHSMPHEIVEPMTAQLSELQKKATKTAIGVNRLQTAEGNPVPIHFQAAEGTPVVAEAARETVSQESFERIMAEFSDCANVIPRIASLIVRDHVRTLGESMKEFPKTRLTTLLESLSKEIPDDKLRVDFCARL